MPLPPSIEREELHLRRIELRGYRRADALYEVEARITDTKSHPHKLDDSTLPPGAALHDMWIRMVIDENLLVQDIVASTDASPYGICGEAVGSLAQPRRDCGTSASFKLTRIRLPATSPSTPWSAVLS